MAKKLEALISSPISEAVKQAVIDAAVGAGGANPNAAVITRDANGKVIKVSVNLPDTAAAAARAAIEANSGVASVDSKDIPVGYNGDDGSEASKDALVAAGFKFDKFFLTTPGREIVPVWNADGTVTYTFPGLQTSAERTYFRFRGSGFTAQDAVTSMYPLKCREDVKFKLAYPLVGYDFTFVLVSGGYAVTLYVQPGGNIRSFTQTGWTLEPVTISDNNWHTFGIEFDDVLPAPNMGNLYLDGVKFKAAFAPSPVGLTTFTRVEYVLDNWAGAEPSFPSPARVADIDYWRWLKP